ncbi:PfkB family carbohydrate kinase [Lichenibacterium minor]|uniref:PfkB family carbohydrate kinase n=1 Tax=Lichenibacterium minor TaxID=2316528 RepID=UPI0013EAB089|nr:PfkB family carbohydrate kinase [Lichenibacterium minor]
MTRVFVLGNATLDCVQRAPRLPRPGETLLGEVPRRCAGGKGLNQAVASARAGAETVLVAPLGSDPEGAALRAAAAGETGLTARWIASAEPTDYSAIWVAADGENAILSSAAAALSLGEGDALAALDDFAGGDVLVMQGNLGRDVTAAAARFARARGGRMLLNTAPIAWDMAQLLDAVDIVVANEGESLALTGEADPSRAALALGGALGAGRTAVVTRGAAGALLARDGDLATIAAPAVHAVDTAGAGDVLAGVLAGLIARGEPVERALVAAVGAASIAVTRHGTVPSFPSRREIAGLAVGGAGGG